MRAYLNLVLVVGLLFSGLVYAGSLSLPVTFEVGLGRSSFDRNLSTQALTAKGYTVNTYNQGDIDDNSNSFSIALDLTPKLNVELGVFSLGKVKSTLDMSLPVGKTNQEAAEDVVGASPHQAGGLLATFGMNYIQPVYSRLDLRVGAGWLIGKDEHRITINNQDIDISKSVNAPYLKLGFGINMSRGFSLTAHTERYFFDDPIDRYGVGLSYTYR